MPPAGGPERGVVEKAMRCENSEVLPAGSVAVAVTRAPDLDRPGSVTSNGPAPFASVVTWEEPM